MYKLVLIRHGESAGWSPPISGRAVESLSETPSQLSDERCRTVAWYEISSRFPSEETRTSYTGCHDGPWIM